MAIYDYSAEIQAVLFTFSGISLVFALLKRTPFLVGTSAAFFLPAVAMLFDYSATYLTFLVILFGALFLAKLKEDRSLFRAAVLIGVLPVTALLYLLFRGPCLMAFIYSKLSLAALLVSLAGSVLFYTRLYQLEN